LGGATNTGQALQFVLDSGFQGARGGSVPKVAFFGMPQAFSSLFLTDVLSYQVAIVLTDGQSQDEVAEAGKWPAVHSLVS